MVRRRIKQGGPEQGGHKQDPGKKARSRKLDIEVEKEKRCQQGTGSNREGHEEVRNNRKSQGRTRRSWEGNKILKGRGGGQDGQEEVEMVKKQGSEGRLESG